MKFLILILAFPVLAVSCSPLKPVKDTSVHHLLEAEVPERRPTGGSPAIAVSRPSLPSYLDRQQLVSRSGEGELKMNSYHLWAEPLDSAISRVTAVNLGRLTNSNNIQPVENFVTLDYQSLLEIRIARFEPDSSGNLTLECTWKLQPVAGRVASVRPFRTVVALPAPAAVSREGAPASPGPLAGHVAAMNEALVRLAREIARSL